MPDRGYLTHLATDAGAVIKQRFGERVAFQEKARYDLVSDVDKEVEALIVSRIRDAFPGDAIWSEEMGRSGADGERLWLVDPLDGTANFLFGVPHVAVSIAIAERGQITHGVVHNPLSDELFFAEAGAALLNGRPITCSDRAELNGCLVSVGLSMIPANVERVMHDWRRLFEVQKTGLALLAPALNICAVACGRTDAFIDFGSSATGHAAAAFVLQQAGGKATNYDFTEWDCRTTGIVASNGRLHADLEALAAGR